MSKLYYIESEGYYDPKLVRLNVDIEQFTLSLYEKLYALMATNKQIKYGETIEVCGVNILLASVLEKEYGAFNYTIKDIKDDRFLDLEILKPIQIGESNENLFFLSYRCYLPDTEDDYEMKFAPITCKDEETFRKEFKAACEKHIRKKNVFTLDFYGVNFSSDDVYHIDRNGKIDIFYPNITEVK